MRKIIFLDIDGVLNVIPQGHDKFGGIFHPHLVDNLTNIIKQTGADIVISSSWRMNGLIELRAMWKERKLPGELVGVTPILYKHVRGAEIEQWLQQNFCDKYVIIDDDIDMLPSQLPYFIKTSGNVNHEDCIPFSAGLGLTKICAEKAIQILNSL
jgi:hypothetical protein